MSAAVDLTRARVALAHLDRIAAHNPELAPLPAGPPTAEAINGWAETLQEHEMADREPTKLVAFRLPLSLIERLDRYAEKVERADLYGRRFTRSGAARALLVEALEAKEKEVQRG